MSRKSWGKIRHILFPRLLVPATFSTIQVFSDLALCACDVWCPAWWGLLDIGGWGVNEILDVQYRIFFEYSKLHYTLHNVLYESELFVLTTHNFIHLLNPSESSNDYVMLIFIILRPHLIIRKVILLYQTIELMIDFTKGPGSSDCILQSIVINHKVFNK